MTRQSSIRNGVLTSFALAWLLSISSVAPALAAGGTAEDQHACTPDVFRLCWSEIPDEQRIVRCLNRQIKQLSPECRHVMEGDGARKDGRK